MSIVINTNSAAISASNNLAASNSMLQKSLNRLSSGSKIVNPSDDAGGLAVSMKLSAAAKRSAAANSNVGNAMSYLQTQDGALKVAGKVLDRMSELATLYSDVTKNPTDQGNYDAEFTELKEQLSALAGETFNGIGLFDDAADPAGLDVVVSEDGTQTVNLAARNLKGDAAATEDKGAQALAAVLAADSLGSFTIGEGEGEITGAPAAIQTISEAIGAVATMRADNGSEQSRLSFASEVLTVNKANLEAANSRIVDVDVAEESTQLARWSTLVQAGTAMLAQANQSSQSALRLLN